MSFLSAKQPKPRGYRQLYREEVKAQTAADIKRQVRDDVKRERRTPEERRARIKKQALDDAGASVQAKDKFFKNAGGGITIRKDALSRLRSLGKR